MKYSMMLALVLFSLVLILVWLGDERATIMVLVLSHIAVFMAGAGLVVAVVHLRDKAEYRRADVLQQKSRTDYEHHRAESQRYQAENQRIKNTRLIGVGGGAADDDTVDFSTMWLD